MLYYRQFCSLALALIGSKSSELQGGKLNFAALFCYFCKNTSFSPTDIKLTSHYILLNLWSADLSKVFLK